MATTIKLPKGEREAIARGKALNHFKRYWSLLMYLRGLTLDEVIELWWEANGYTDGKNDD